LLRIPATADDNTSPPVGVVILVGWLVATPQHVLPAVPSWGAAAPMHCSGFAIPMGCFPMKAPATLDVPLLQITVDDDRDAATLAKAERA
jgi:hypothetical protein